MKKKILLAVCALTAATAMTVGFAACGDDDKGMSAEDANAKIATFTSSPSTVSATFKQTYKLEVNSDNTSFKSFEKDIADTVTVNLDFTAGNLYYYGKKVSKDNSVVEQLVVKEGNAYSFLDTTTEKKTLENEAAAKKKINELLTSLSKQTTGYVDGDAFVYGKDWVHTYLLLGSGTLNGSEKSFTYSYNKAEGDGLKVNLDMQYVGYYGDAGTFEFGTDTTHTGAKAEIVTDSKGYITSFSQTLNNHLDMRITSTPIPLDLTGTRTLTATYNGTLTKKAASDITQNIPTTSEIKVGSVEHATVTTYDFKNGDFSTLAKPSNVVTKDNFVAVKVVCDEGYEVSSVKVNGNDTKEIQGYYCLMQPATAGATYNVAVVVAKKGAETPATGTIVVTSVEHCTVKTYDCTVKTYDFNLNNMKESLAATSTTVTVGNFVAVKVECEAGYKLKSVTVNGTAGVDYSGGQGYYCVKATEGGITYTVVVELEAA